MFTFESSIVLSFNTYKKCIERRKNLIENHATHMVSEIYTKNQSTKKTQVCSCVAKTKNESNNFKSEKSQDYSRKHRTETEIVKI